MNLLIWSSIFKAEPRTKDEVQRIINNKKTMFLKFLKTKGSNVMFVHIHSIETKSEQISTEKVILHFWAIPQINNSEVKIF